MAGTPAARRAERCGPRLFAFGTGKRDGGGQAGGDFTGEGGTGQDRDRAARRGALATWFIRRPVPASMPLEHSTRSRGCSGKAASTLPMCCAGVTTSSASRPPISSQGRRLRGLCRKASPWAGKGFVRAELISATSSASRAQISTSRPSLASICASAVPHAPAPITRRSCLHSCAAHGFSLRIERPARGRAEMSSGSSWPSRSIPAHAIIAALSVHSLRRRRGKSALRDRRQAPRAQRAPWRWPRPRPPPPASSTSVMFASAIRSRSVTLRRPPPAGSWRRYRRFRICRCHMRAAPRS